VQDAIESNLRSGRTLGVPVGNRRARHRHGRARLIVSVHEPPALRRDAEHRQIAGRDPQNPEPRGTESVADVRALLVVGLDGFDGGKRSIVPAEMVERRRGDVLEVVRLIAIDVIDPDEAVRIGEGQRLQEHRVERAEHRGVRAETQRQDSQDSRGEAGVATGDTPSRPEVAADALED
jgi:hypothetical protein